MYQPRNHLANEHKWWLWHFNGDIIYAKLIEEWLDHCSLQKYMMVDKKMIRKEKWCRFRKDNKGWYLDFPIV